MAGRVVFWRAVKLIRKFQAPKIHRLTTATLWGAASERHVTILCVPACLKQTRTFMDATGQDNKISGEDYVEIDEETLRLLNSSYDNPDPRDVPVDNKEETHFTGEKNFNPAKLELPLIHIKATYNNTIITITDPKGKVLGWTSAGACGYKNARRGTTFAAQSAGMTAAQKAHSFGIKRCHVKLKGPGPGRQPSLKGLELGGMQVVTLQDVTPIPHNGCRPRKARKL